jgi:putative PEP-CTERM system histidine kinase
LCLGLGAGFVFDLYLFADALLFGRIDAGVWAARGFAHALAIPFIAIATARNKDWTIDIAVSRGVVFHSTAFLASGIYLLTVAAAGYYVRYFGGSWGKTLQVGFIFAALLLLGWLFFSGAVRSRLRVFINKHFFSYRYDYRQEWLRFTNLLSARDTNVSSAQRSIQALANLVESPGGSLWLHDSQDGYAQAARWNMPAAQPHESADGSLPRFLAKTGWVVDLHQFAREPSRYPDLRLPEWLSRLPAAWLVVPVVAQEELTGFVVLATPRAAVDVNWEVLDLLKTAARQVGSFLAQVQASEALLEARKFESFNKMSSFVVHDLKNLVAQLSLLLKNAERHRHNPRFQDDMFSTIKHVGERMNKLLLQLSTGSRGEENLRPVQLGRLVERVLAAKQAERQGIELKTAAGEVATLGFEQRLERVIGHLVQNAIDATPGDGTIRMSVSSEGGNAVVEVEDSGCGMSEEFVRERLFRPFETTKGTGMGIGVYEAAQYVKEMDGRIEVDSRPGSGTRLRVILPLHRDPAALSEPVREVA